VLPIYLLTDYGLSDEFTGVLKAVILRIAPGATVVDLNHAIPPFDVLSGARCLERCVPYLSKGVVLAIVDPQVGTRRRAIAVEVKLYAPEGRIRSVDSMAVDRTADQSRLVFVGPDNGILLGAVDKLVKLSETTMVGEPIVVDKPIAVDIDIDKVAPPFPRVGTTFDGRDLFAPAAALLAKGIRLDDIGDRVGLQELVRLPNPHLLHDKDSLETEVIWVDHFGNVQLSATSDLGEALPLVILVDSGVKRVKAHKVRTFDELDEFELGVMEDSNGYLALVARQANAAELLDVSMGDLVTLSTSDHSSPSDRSGEPT